jgi:hypothetical protein
MLGVWNEILVGLQHVRAIAHRRQVLDLLPKELSSFDRPSSTDKSEDLAKDGVHRWSEPTLGFFLAMNVQSSSISMKEQALVCGELSESAWAACTNQRETVL